MELYKKYRPTNLKQVIGQDDVVKSLVEMGRRREIPHFILFVGPSGTGKTTLARILRKKLKCADHDFIEINAANDRGIDLVRGIEKYVGLKPIAGECRVWLLDESHMLTSEAMGAFLKLLEDTPPHAYFIFCTTDPQKLKPTIRTRATEFVLRALKPSELSSLVTDIIGKEGASVSEEVVDRLVDVADGSARKALVLLHSIIGIEGDENQLDTIAKGDYKAKSIEIARGLLNGIPWGDMCKILKGVDEEPEQLRYMVLGYCSAVLLNGGKQAKKAARILGRFQDNLYDSKIPGFRLACYEILVGLD